mmetsp:Transcript_835/g.1760  ORF Transcript_835/g.1760 Transcript_835/m.1760 type:complete len:476 (-) Transcript_835:1055-2482(-)
MVAWNSAVEAELAAAGLAGIIADLYAMDRRVDGVTDASRARDEVAAILELYNIDVNVDTAQAKKAEVGVVASIRDICDSILIDLWSVDNIVKNARMGDNSAYTDVYGQEDNHFVDPHEAAALRQIQLFAARDLHNEARIGDIVELLRNDIAIDGQRHHDIDMEGVDTLLAVDQSVDGSKAASCRQHDISDVLCLLEVDRAVDRRKSEANTAPTGPKDPMEAMFEIDCLVDGTKEHNKEEMVEAMISDLRRVDLSVDKIFMPDIFGMMGANDSASSQARGEDHIDQLPPPPVFDDDNEDTAGERSIVSSKEKSGESAYSRQTRDAIRKLSEVDQEVDSNKKTSRRTEEPEMHIMLDLFKVDLEVDKAKMAAFASSGISSGTSNSPAAHRRHSGPKRSIFTSKEKEGSKVSNIIGTTTVVNNKKRIGSIPLGQVVTSNTHREFFGKAEMAPIDPYSARQNTHSGSKADNEDEQCTIM